MLFVSLKSVFATEQKHLAYAGLGDRASAQ